MNSRLIVSILLIAAFFCLESLWPYSRGRRHRIKHAFPNIIIAVLNGLLSRVLLAGMIAVVMNWSKVNTFGLLYLIHFPAAVKGVIAFILFDLWMYFWHRANHRIPFLWRFHRVHHTDIEMDTTTALRFHPIEIVYSILARLMVVPFLGINYFQLLIYELVLQLVILFHHSNIGLPEKVDKIFRSGIVTPNMHRVHHSREREETDSNYSSVFSFWDRIFATFRKRDNTLSITYGLTKFRQERWQGLAGILLTPFR